MMGGSWEFIFGNPEVLHGVFIEPGTMETLYLTFDASNITSFIFQMSNAGGSGVLVIYAPCPQVATQRTRVAKSENPKARSCTDLSFSSFQGLGWGSLLFY